MWWCSICISNHNASVCVLTFHHGCIPSPTWVLHLNLWNHLLVPLYCQNVVCTLRIHWIIQQIDLFPRFPSQSNAVLLDPSPQCPLPAWAIGPAVRADFWRLYPANAKTPTCCPSDDNRTKVTNSVTSAWSLWWHVGPYFWPADLTRTADPIVKAAVRESTLGGSLGQKNIAEYWIIPARIEKMTGFFLLC